MPSLRSVPAADNLASRLRDIRRARRAHTEPSEHGPRELILIAFTVPLVTVVVTLLVVLAVLALAGSALSGVGVAVATCWLAINQVPVTVGGVSIGVLPLLPTLLVAAGTAKMVASSGRTRTTLTEMAAAVAAAVGGAVLVTAICVAVVMDGSATLPIQSPGPLQAFSLTVVIQGLAAALGAALGSEFPARTLSVTDRRGIRYGVVAVLALMAAGGVFVFLRLVMRFGELGDVIATGGNFDGYLGLTMLSVLYLPNVVVGAAAVLVGSEVHIGAVSVDLFAVRGGTVPPLPVLAVLPGQSVWWAAFGLAVPAMIGAFVAWRCRSADLMVYARTMGMAAALAATAMVVLGWLAGGSLGELGATGVTVVTAGAFTLGWVVVAGAVVALIHNILPTLRASGSRAPAEDDWLDDMPFDDMPFDDTAFDDDYLAECDDPTESDDPADDAEVPDDASVDPDDVFDESEERGDDADEHADAEGADAPPAFDSRSGRTDPSPVES